MSTYVPIQRHIPYTANYLVKSGDYTNLCVQRRQPCSPTGMEAVLLRGMSAYSQSAGNKTGTWRQGMSCPWGQVHSEEPAPCVHSLARHAPSAVAPLVAAVHLSASSDVPTSFVLSSK